ncbi:MAG: hypothetical protein GY711_28650, partial [bacterium]|nr:hypothetical protein [bacterium]
RLSNSGRRESTRRLATAARIDFGGPAFVAAEARRSGSVLRLLDSAAFVENGDARESLFDLALGHLRARHQGELSPAGRFVRIELAGKERTLSLAEVEVFVRGDNVAPRGVATQSTLNWGGVPGRALDGNRSGRWSDDGQTHTLEDQPDPWWELDLGAEHAVEQIVLWNRTDGELGKRLDGFVVRVLDEERRAVFEHAGGPAEERNAVELTAPALRARRVAARALAALRVREDAAIDALVSHFGDPDLRLAVVQGMRAIPFARWPRDSVESVGGALLMHFSSRSPEDYDTRGGREILALADEIAPFLESIDAEAGRLFRDLRRRLGPQVFVIRPVPDSLLFDRTELTVVAGHPVELFFDNTDLMPHNLLVAAPRSLAVVGMAAERMAQQPDAWDKGFVPDLPEVLYAMDLLQPGQSGTLRFDAPTDPDDYPYVCTFPGHWVRMNGVMHVVADWDDVALPSAAASAEPALPSRPFVRNWTTDDLRPHLRKVLGASAERGRVVLDDASCLTCHAIDSEGGVTGPDLTEVVERYGSVEELLDQIVDPSAQILEGYESEIFLTTDGHVVSGHIVRDEGDVLLVQDDPYRDDYLELPVDEIEERATSSVSLMPAGLLSTFEREEILDLLAFLESLRAR